MSRRERKQEERDEKRVFRFRIRFLGIACAVLWTALAGRLFYIQVLSHEDLALASTSQYQVAVEGMDTRGVILDRNFNLLTGGTNQYYYFLSKDRENVGSRRLLSSISARDISDEDSSYSAYRSQIFDETVNDKLKSEYGAYVYCCPSRYSDHQTACHLIGYLNQAEKKGVSGLELLCEDVLKADDSRLTLWADGKGSLLLGVAPKLENNDTIADHSVTTTIDKGVQSVCEEALADREFEGAVLVSEAESGEILAWASSPVFNPNTIEAYLESDGDYLVNKCIQGGYSPGSVFKIVVAAAALEAGICDPEEEFICDGKVTVEGIELGCTSGPEEGHGKVNMYEAMAQSCNCYFATLGEKLGYRALLEMASAMGFGEKVFSLFAEETSGNLPSAEETGQWDISNLSIGQGEILATPAQIQRMMSIVANGGVDRGLRIFSEKNEKEGNAYRDLNKSRRIFSSKTAEILQHMLSMVMEEGTGSGRSWPCPVYGKTGTAETVDQGAEVKNCWFSGYCHVNSRNYVVTVLAEHGKSGSATALPVFTEIVEYLNDRNYSLY